MSSCYLYHILHIVVYYCDRQGRIQDLKKEGLGGEFLNIGDFLKNLTQKRVGVRPPLDPRLTEKATTQKKNRHSWPYLTMVKVVPFSPSILVILNQCWFNIGPTSNQH